MSIVTEKEESASKRRIGRGRHGLNLDIKESQMRGISIESKYLNSQTLKILKNK